MSGKNAQPEELSKKELQKNDFNINKINSSKKTIFIYKYPMSPNSYNSTIKQQWNPNIPEIKRLKKKIGEMHKDLGKRIDNGFLNFQIFLENLFSQYFSKSSEDQKIQSYKVNIPLEQKGLKDNGENYEEKKIKLEQIISSHSKKSKAPWKKILRKIDFTVQNSPKRETENKNLLSWPSVRIRVSNDRKNYHSKDNKIVSIRRKYENRNKRKKLINF